MKVFKLSVTTFTFNERVKICNLLIIFKICNQHIKTLANKVLAPDTFLFIIKFIYLWWWFSGKSCPALEMPWTVCSLPGSSVLGILQARILEYVAISFSTGSSQPRDQTQSPTLQVDSLPFDQPGKLYLFLIEG